MDYSIIKTKIESGDDIPEPITQGLLEIIGTPSVWALPEQKRRALSEGIRSLFYDQGIKDYGEIALAYTLYYLPVNMQKVWRPLMELAEAELLRPHCRMLELGAGPGTSTFGLLEFYRCLALANPSEKFNLKITVVEREKAFRDIFKILYKKYLQCTPKNLSLRCILEHSDVVPFLQSCKEMQYDLVLESNLINPNERISPEDLETIAKHICTTMKPQASAIFIEPAKPELTTYLKILRIRLMEQGMNCFGPCCCDNPDCLQVSSARLDLRKIMIYNDLQKNGIISREGFSHSYVYAVYRKDGQRRVFQQGTGIRLDDLRYLGLAEMVDFKAFILACSTRNEDSISIKICDGSLPGRKGVWFEIPYAFSGLSQEQIDVLKCGLGGMIDVEGAVVDSDRKLGFYDPTFIKKIIR